MTRYGIEPSTVEKLRAQLAEKEREIEALKNLPMRFMVKGGPVVMSDDFDRMRERAEAAEQRLQEAQAGTLTWKGRCEEPIGGNMITQLNISELAKAAEVAIAQAASGELHGKAVEAAYNAALETSNRMWEWYSGTNRRLEQAICDLRRRKEHELA